MTARKNNSAKHIRKPVADIIRRSPFKALETHHRKVNECIKALDKAVKYYVKEEYKKAVNQIKKVIELEHEADLIKGNIRAHLPKFIFMPIDRSDFLMLLREQDAVLDYAEDVAVLMEMRNTPVPKKMQKDFIAHTEKVVETVFELEKAVHGFVEIMESSLGHKKREELKQIIHNVHKKEWEADQIEFKISKQLFNLENEDPIGVIHLLKVVERTAQIANHAENAADRLRAMIAK
ncbi:MAG: TIGR00153 family protein [Thermoplasmata archaeon]|nr:MAG: TIGR00153 family protein [Thermoplasmata archaeon]